MAKKGKTTAVAGDSSAGRKRESGWVRSKFTSGDLRKLRQHSLLLAKTEVKVPGDEAVPHSPEGWRIIFFHFLLRGLSLPAHEFVRGLLFSYGLQLHQLTPNSILHIACFITLCEFFLGIAPHWGLWRRIFLVRRNIT
jgi:hypothetical protein